MRLLLRQRDPDLIHNNQYLQHYSDICDQSNKRSMIFLLPYSSNKNQPTNASSGASQVRRYSFHSSPCMCILAASLPNIPEKCFTRWPVHCLSSSCGCRGRHIKPDVLDLLTDCLAIDSDKGWGCQCLSASLWATFKITSWSQQYRHKENIFLVVS